MANPTKNEVHVNKPLTNISVAYMQDLNAFVADQVFPKVAVAKQSDRYIVYDKADFYRDEMKLRAPASESAGAGFRIDNTPTYYCAVYALHKDIDDQLRANVDEPINLDEDTTKFLTQKMMLKKDKIFVENYFKTGVWGTDYTPSTLWSAANSTPVKDIDAQKDSVYKKTGYMPNVLVVTSDVHTVLKNHPDVLDRVKYTQQATISEQLLASLFGVQKYLVLRTIENKAAEGASADFDFLASKKALLVYAASAPSLMTPSAGYSFVWQGLTGSIDGVRVKNFRLEHLAADRIEIEAAFDLKVVAADLGVFFNGVIA
jgi:hypothetical protein